MWGIFIYSLGSFIFLIILFYETISHFPSCFSFFDGSSRFIGDRFWRGIPEKTTKYNSVSPVYEG